MVLHYLILAARLPYSILWHVLVWYLLKNFEIFARGNAAGWLETWIAYSFPAQKLSLHFIGEKLFGIILLCMWYLI